MSRIVVIGNAGGGKSTLSRQIVAARHLPFLEVDRLLWRPGWHPTPKATYDAEHARAIGRDAWLIDGLGQLASIAARIERATHVILIDMPLWMHFWLAAERQIHWARGAIPHPPGEIQAMPPTEALFRTIWDVDQHWMPQVRDLCVAAERHHKPVHRLHNVAEINAYAEQFKPSPVGEATRGGHTPPDHH